MERSVQFVKGSLTVTIPSEMAQESNLRKGSRVKFQRHPRGILMDTTPRSNDTMTTIGYQGRESPDFVQSLVDEAVEILVDVRELPVSRKKGFGKNQMREAISSVGIDYVHMKGLGAPKDVRDPFKAGGSFDEFRHAYLRHLETRDEDLDELEELAKQKHVAIMCFEKTHSMCHRQFVADELGRRGMRIVHA